MSLNDNTNKIAAILAKANALPDKGEGVALDTTLSEAGKAADAKAVGDALAEKQPKGDYLTQADLQTATNEVLAQAKASGEFDGADGTTPHIGDNGNWFVGSDDTGKPSRGEKGDKGDTGAAGSSIQSIQRTSGTGASGTTDTYTVTLTNGDTTTFQVYNGKDGSGSGDMKKAVYDPKGKAQDIFSYADTKYSKPSGGIPKKDLASDVQTSLGKADSALQSAPVTSVNSKTGAVNLAKGDVGLGNVDNVKQYSASNPPPYPVTSVNGKTGAVTVSIPTVPSTTSLIKGNGSGGLVEATRGNDYIASGNITKQTLVATETTPTENYAINWVYG